MSTVNAQVGSSAITSERLEQAALDFISGPENDLRLPGSVEPAFGLPLFGYTAGEDPLWREFKMVVGDCHWTPEEAFRLAFPDKAAKAEELTVISWILPQTKITRQDNRKETFYPAERWARSRIMGEKYVNVGLRNHLVQTLTQAGIDALAPMLLPEWGKRESEKYVYVSNWSERHAAYAAGLGTFGLCDGLITPLGKAMRTGSVIARLRLPASGRPYKQHQEYCLFYNSGTCGKCIKRCPVDAISPKGHDKVKCARHLGSTTVEFVKREYGFDGYGCGLCQVGVPCESGIPPRPKQPPR